MVFYIHKNHKEKGRGYLCIAHSSTPTCKDQINRQPQLEQQCWEGGGDPASVKPLAKCCCGFSAAGQWPKYGVGVLWFQYSRTVTLFWSIVSVCCSFSAAGQWTCFEACCWYVLVLVRQYSDLVLKYGVGVLWFQCGRTVTCFEVWCGCVVVSVWQADRPLSGGAGPVLCGLCQVRLLAGWQVSVCSEQTQACKMGVGGGGEATWGNWMLVLETSFQLCFQRLKSWAVPEIKGK